LSGSNSPQTVVVAAGTYAFSNTTLTIADTSHLSIEAYDVTLIFYFGYGVSLSNCANVSVRGLTLDSDPPNYAQGTITQVPNSTRFIADFDGAFLPPDTAVQPFSNPGGTAGAKVRFWDPTSRLVLPASVTTSSSTAQTWEASHGSLR
jgi:hypothetical protein